MPPKKPTTKYKPIPSSVPSKKRTTTKPAKIDESRRLTDAQKRTVLPKQMQPNVVAQPPKTPLSNKGMSIKDILANTPRMMKENGEDIIFKSYKSLTSPKGLQVIKAVVVHRNPMMPKAEDCPHEVTVIGLSDQTKPISKQAKVFVSCNCLSGDMRVKTSNGLERIEDLARPFEPETYPVTYIVHYMEYQGSAPYFTGNKEVFRVELSCGSILEGTADHRFMAEDSSWVEIKDFVVGTTRLLVDCSAHGANKSEVVTSITSIGVKPVYDITVPIVESFVVAGGFIAHNCENFCYWWEYALAVHGATHIIYGNGEPPIMTNQHLVPGCCKHAVGVMRRIVRDRK